MRDEFLTCTCHANTHRGWYRYLDLHIEILKNLAATQRVKREIIAGGNGSLNRIDRHFVR